MESVNIIILKGPFEAVNIILKGPLEPVNMIILKGPLEAVNIKLLKGPLEIVNITSKVTVTNQMYVFSSNTVLGHCCETE